MSGNTSEALDSENWTVNGDVYFPLHDGTREALIPAGIYRIGFSQSQGWFLSKEKDRYDLSFKIYGTNDAVIDRCMKAWENTDENLSVLLNGLKGTGKTVSAQIITNKFIDMGIPVITMKGYDPSISEVLNNLKQPCVVLLDEFEKMFSEEKHQNAMLSVISGLGRGIHRRFFLLTTNETKISPYMKDRPGRIRYIFQFSNLSQELIQEIIEDRLDPDLSDYGKDILEYCKTLEVLSIDAITSVIDEVNIFREPPASFKDIFNLSARKAAYWDMIIVDPETGEDKGFFDDISTPLKSNMERLASYDTCPVEGREVTYNLRCFGFLNKNTALVAKLINYKETAVYKLGSARVKKAIEREFRGISAPKFLKSAEPKGFDIEVINSLGDDELADFASNFYYQANEYGPGCDFNPLKHPVRFVPNTKTSYSFNPHSF